MVHYADTSALVKLIVAEPESAALRRWAIEGNRTLVSSDLTRTELIRSVRRGAPELAVPAREVLESIELVTLSTATYEAAAHLDPSILRSLDAIHLAAALELGDDLESLVTYDTRLAKSAAALGIPVSAPAG